MTTLWPILHRCGHRVDWDLSHKHPIDRAGFARWLALRDCTACWWAKRRGRRRQYKPRRKSGIYPNALVEWENAAGMPALSGSDRAVAWARKIRRRLVTGALPHLAGVSGGTDEAAVVLVGHIRTITTAGWWIDHRKVEAGDLVAALVHPTPDRRRREQGRV